MVSERRHGLRRSASGRAWRSYLECPTVVIAEPHTGQMRASVDGLRRDAGCVAKRRQVALVPVCEPPVRVLPVKGLPVGDELAGHRTPEPDPVEDGRDRRGGDVRHEGTGTDPVRTVNRIRVRPGQLQELYGTENSSELVSRVTEPVRRDWAAHKCRQARYRPLSMLVHRAAVRFHRATVHFLRVAVRFAVSRAGCHVVVARPAQRLPT